MKLAACRPELLMVTTVFVGMRLRAPAAAGGGGGGGSDEASTSKMIALEWVRQRPGGRGDFTGLKGKSMLRHHAGIPLLRQRPEDPE